MSRSDYSDDLEQSALAMWRGAVNSAIHGKRGQKLLRDMAAALDAMPTKVLIARELQTPNGEVCALGAVGAARHIDMSGLDPEDSEKVAAVFGIAPALAREIAYVNDEFSWEGRHGLGERWRYVRAWVGENLAIEQPAP